MDNNINNEATKYSSCFAPRLNGTREAMGMTRVKLADTIGVSRNVISMYELGQRFPSLDTLGRIADCLGVSIDYLLGRTESKYVNTDEATAKMIDALNNDEATIKANAILDEMFKKFNKHIDGLARAAQLKDDDDYVDISDLDEGQRNDLKKYLDFLRSK